MQHSDKKKLLCAACVPRRSQTSLSVSKVGEKTDLSTFSNIAMVLQMKQQCKQNSLTPRRKVTDREPDGYSLIALIRVLHGCYGGLDILQTEIQVRNAIDLVVNKRRAIERVERHQWTVSARLSVCDPTRPRRFVCLRSPTNRHALVLPGEFVSPHSLCHSWFYHY